MRLLEARLVLESPAIVTRRRTERGFVEPSDFIPGSMLRGALLTALYREGKLSEEQLKREAERPSLLASPAYPVVEGARSLPATPYMFRCDRCRKAVDMTQKAAEKLSAGGEPKLELFHECGEPLKPLYGSLVRTSKLESVKPGTFRATSVAIDKARGSAERGMLFDYEAIAEGTEFWAWVLAPDWLQPGEVEVAVGRGQSRGFGWAKLSLRPTRPPSSASPGVFVALSPVAPLKRLEWEGLRISVSRIIGRCSEVQAGWDYALRAPRPIVKLARRGSLVLADASGPGETLRVGVPLDLGGTWLTGVNALLPLDEYYAILGGRA